jgi:hypothetical protein
MLRRAFVQSKMHHHPNCLFFESAIVTSNVPTVDVDVSTDMYCDVHSMLPATVRLSRPLTNVPNFVVDVQNWLDSINITYVLKQQSSLCYATQLTDSTTLYCIQFNHLPKLPNVTLMIHLVPSPTCIQDSLPAGVTRSMTDSAVSSFLNDTVEDSPTPPKAPISVQWIHLHEDVWTHPRTHPIVQARLLCRLGIVSSRIYGRQTTAQRIDSLTAQTFLSQHHLWGSTGKTKHSYGLFIKSKTTKHSIENLVAVATFSSRRNVVRGREKPRTFRSHELIRFCSRRDGTVVGGITKLLAAFIKDTCPDDIVTVIDRDWGIGSTSWHGLGFETVVTMPPIPMVVHWISGARRHLVGAGIKMDHALDTTVPDNQHNIRLGLPPSVVFELASITNYKDAVQCLHRHGYHLVYDAGVERLVLLLTKRRPTSNQTADDVSPQSESTTDIWESSNPQYAQRYYSPNSGINALIRQAENPQNM